MLPQKIFKIQGPRLAKKVKCISLGFNLIKVSQPIALLLNLGILKNCLLDFPPWPPIAAALLFEIKRYVLLVKNPPNPNA